MKEFLVCIDSDGCAINSMECKHRKCFGPYVVDVWNLEAWREEILNRWNDINLYSMTRGINRFLGLEMILTEVSERYCAIDGICHYSRWCRETDTFSNEEIQKQIDCGGHSIFTKVLEWSNRVNLGVEGISSEICPFPGVKETLEKISSFADVAIVSSANSQAVQDEWARFGLMDMVSYVMAQDAGTKSDCIGKLLAMGYTKERTLMLGDALGDQQAAEKNDVWYFPILAGKEVQSWKLFLDEAILKFQNGSYDMDDYQLKLGLL